MHRPFGQSAFGLPVSDRASDTWSLPTLPSLPPKSSQAGARVAFKAVVAPRSTPFGPRHGEQCSGYMGNLYPTREPFRPRMPLPLQTTFPEVKLFDAGIGFPRGDAGPQMLDTRPRLDGDSWIKSAHRQSVFEVNTSAERSPAVRAFRTPAGASGYTPFIMYQSNRAPSGFRGLTTR